MHTLDVLCDIQLGSTPPRKSSRYWDSSKVTSNVWVSIADMPKSGAPVVLDSKEYISGEGAERSRLVTAGTLLLSFKLSIGRLAFAGRDLYTNEAIAALRIRDGAPIIKEYLYWYLSFFDWDAAAKGEEKIKGKTLNKSKLRAIPVLLPPLPEQQRIVAILDEAFAAIETATANTEKNLANAREVFEGYREKQFDGAAPGWTVSPLSSLITVKHGFAFKSQWFAESGDFVLLTPGNFYERGGYRDRGSKQKYYIGDIPDGFVLQEGDLLVAMTEQAPGLLGSPLFVPENNRHLHNQRLGLVRPAADAIWHARFLFHAFNTRRFRRELRDSSTGTKVRHTSPAKIGAFRLAHPQSADEQVRVASKLDDFSEASASLERRMSEKLKELEALRESVLHKAFAGELTADSKAVDRTLAEADV